MGRDPSVALHLATHPSRPPVVGGSPAPQGVLGWSPRELTPRALLELPEKQEQLAAIYAVLEHLPEANHNSLERLIFHLVKQVPARPLFEGWGPRQEPRQQHSRGRCSGGSAPGRGPGLGVCKEP